LIDKVKNQELTVAGLGHVGHAFAVNLVEDGHDVLVPSLTQHEHPAHTQFSFY
jgi:3-hydroxyisobutyrate dehydrogenase-like beta-hydroxyacid dehydrogenase